MNFIYDFMYKKQINNPCLNLKAPLIYLSFKSKTEQKLVHLLLFISVILPCYIYKVLLGNILTAGRSLAAKYLRHGGATAILFPPLFKYQKMNYFNTS